VVRDLCDAILEVDEDDIISATALVWSRMKLQIEPSAGVGVACALGQPLRSLVGKKCPHVAAEGRQARVGVILCGGNADASVLAPLLAAAKPYPTGALVSP